MRRLALALLALVSGLPTVAGSQDFEVPLELQDEWARFLATLPPEDVVHPFVLTNAFMWCDRELGCSKSFPVAQTIHVRSQQPPALPCSLDKIGPIVKSRLFPDVPDFTFRVIFASAAWTSVLGTKTRSDYADPRSHWYDIFFGSYDVTWQNDRPFAYGLQGGRFAFDPDEVVVLGEADWNHFSNRIYGVPRSEVERNDAPDPDVEKAPPKTEIVGRYRWDVIDAQKSSVVSPYRAQNGAPYETFDACLTPLWAFIFGRFDPVSEVATSYQPVRLHASGFACWEKLPDRGGRDQYSTHIFGGTVNMDFKEGNDPVGLNKRFLERQLRSIRETIQKDSRLPFGTAQIHCDDSFLVAPPP